MGRSRVATLAVGATVLALAMATGAGAATVRVTTSRIPDHGRVLDDFRAVRATDGTVVVDGRVRAHRTLHLADGVYILAADAWSARSTLVASAGVIARSGHRAAVTLRLHRATAGVARAAAGTVAAAGDAAVVTAQGVTITGAAGTGQPPIVLDGALDGYLFDALHGDGVRVVDDTPQFQVAAAEEQILAAGGRLASPFTFNPLNPTHVVRGEGTISRDGRVNLELRLDDDTGAIVAIVNVSGKAKNLRDVVVRAVNALAVRARDKLRPKPVPPPDCEVSPSPACDAVQVTVDGLFDQTGGWGSGSVTAPGRSGSVNEGFDSVEHGSLGSWAKGTRFSLLATPSRGSHFDHWGGACSGASPSCTLTAGPGLDATAYFAEDLWTLTIVNQNPAGGAVGGTQIGCGLRETMCSRVLAGQTSDTDLFRLTISPEASHMVSSLQGCDAFSGSFVDGGTCSVAMTANKTVTVNFACNPNATTPCSGTPTAADLRSIVRRRR